MGHDYTADSTGQNVHSYTLPDGGDFEAVADVDVPFEQLADNVRRMDDRGYCTGQGNGEDWYQVSLEAPMVNAAVTSPPDPEWHFSTAIGARWYQKNTDPGELWWPLGKHLPMRGRLVEMRATLIGAGGPGGAGHAALPATLPIMTLLKVDYGAGSAVATVATGTDAPADAAAYDGQHELVIAGIAEDIGPEKAYYVKLTGEGGMNAAPDELALIAIRYRMEQTP